MTLLLLAAADGEKPCHMGYPAMNCAFACTPHECVLSRKHGYLFVERALKKPSKTNPLEKSFQNRSLRCYRERNAQGDRVVLALLDII